MAVHTASALQVHDTMGQNDLLAEHLMIHFLTSSGVSKRASEYMSAAEYVSEESREKRAMGSKRAEQIEQCRMSERKVSAKRTVPNE